MATNSASGQKRGPEPYPKDERARRLKKEVGEIMDSDAFRRVAAEVTKDASVKSELKANPKGLLERKGIRIPEGVDVRFREGYSPDQKRGPEQDPKEVERVRRLEKELDDIMDSDAFRRVAAEVTKDASVKSELKANPKGLLERKGIRIPEGVDVRHTEEYSHCICFVYLTICCDCWWVFCWCYPCYRWYCYCW